jgi:hypothetical protein
LILLVLIWKIFRNKDLGNGKSRCIGEMTRQNITF